MPWRQPAWRQTASRTGRRKLHTQHNIAETAALSKKGLDIAPTTRFRIGIVTEAIVESE
jgi:hypothetical protein